MGAAYFPTISDCDFDNDGVITQADLLAIIAAGEDGYMAIVGAYESGDTIVPIWEWIPPPPYNRRYDTNFDDVIDDTDAFYVSALWEKSANIDAIRDALKEDAEGNIEYASLNWGDWQAYLVALDVSDKVLYYGSTIYYSERLSDFTGIDYAGKDIPGWISVHKHSESGYVCGHFASDTLLASYKILGYGCLLKGISTTHAYNMLWTGGDWTQLSNWIILEPCYGAIVGINAADPLLKGTIYETIYIQFPRGYTTFFQSANLYVNFNAGIVTYGDVDSSTTSTGIEESVPISFDVTLGIPITTIVPTVTTQAATISATIARLSGQISNDGGEACQYRFRYKKSGGAYSYTSWTGAKTTGQTFYENISDLDNYSLYYFNAQAKNSIGESAWGSELDFTTLVAIPTVTTEPADQIEEVSVMGHGTITETGGQDCDLRGVEWGIASGSYTNQAIGGTLGLFILGIGSFTRLIEGLTADTTYYYRALARNSAGWGYGNEKIFLTTLSLTAKTSSETGSGAESLGDRDLVLPESGSGVGSISGRAVFRAETGSGAESYKRRILGEVASLTASYQRSGVGSGLDASVEIYTDLAVGKLASDSGSGAESYKRRMEGEVASLIASYDRSETGSGVEALIFGRLLAETGSGADALMARIIEAIEVGSGADARIGFHPSYYERFGSDTGVGNDIMAIILHKERKQLKSFTGRDLSDITTREVQDFAGRELADVTTREVKAFEGRELK